MVAKTAQALSDTPARINLR